LINGCTSGNAKCKSDCCRSTNKNNQTSQDLISYTPISLDTFSRPLVCLLSGQDQIERKEKLKQEIFSQLIGLEELELGYIFKFETSNKLLLELIDYVIVEKECCPFYKYDFSIKPYGEGIELVVSGSKDAKQLIKMFVEEIQYDR